MSRMRYIAAVLQQPIRFVGLSTALANAADLADWLGISPKVRARPRLCWSPGARLGCLAVANAALGGLSCACKEGASTLLCSRSGVSAEARSVQGNRAFFAGLPPPKSPSRMSPYIISAQRICGSLSGGGYINQAGVACP